MRVLVTGANGFVGGHLLARLIKDGHEPVALLGEGQEVGKGIEAHRVDLLNDKQVADLELSGIRAVIHLAGLAAVGPSYDQPRRYIEANTGMQINLFEYFLRRDQRPRMVIISSGTLYAPHTAMPLTEESPVAPSSPYAVSKLAQESLAHYYGGRDFEVIIARPFNHIGPGQNLGFIAPDLASQIAQAEQTGTNELQVGNLDTRRDYTDVRDIARAYSLIVEQGKPGAVYNVCSGQSVDGQTILNTLLTASTLAKASITRDPALARPSDNPEIVGSHDKLTRDTGWKPEIGLEQTLADVLADWRTRV